MTQPEQLNRVQVSKELATDVENVANGTFAPLNGFMGENDYRNVLTEMRLIDDTPWTIPMVFDVDHTELNGASHGDEILLVDPEKRPLGILSIEELYSFDRKEHAKWVYGTNDAAHPGVAKTMQMKPTLVGGKIRGVGKTHDEFEKYALSPSETKVLFRQKGWKTIVGFQTRNVPHMGHENLQKTGLAFVDGIFINPVIGRKKKGDFKDEVILEAYNALVQNYYLKGSAVLAVLRTEMRYAGPREAVFHAIVRRNFGCTHFLIGRDHAGVGKFYHPFAAQEIFKNFPDLGIIPLFFASFFYCRKCAGVANDRICPHDSSQRIDFSGTQLRDYVQRHQTPPPEMIRPEVSEVIMRHPDPLVGESE